MKHCLLVILLANWFGRKLDLEYSMVGLLLRPTLVRPRGSLHWAPRVHFRSHPDALPFGRSLGYVASSSLIY